MRILVLLLCLLSFQAWATVRYAVPTGGATTGTCPIDTPCTLLRCQQLSNTAGDICYLNEGTYDVGINTAGNGTAEAPILYECLGAAGTCIIDDFASAVTDRVIQIDNNYNTISKLGVIVKPIDDTTHQFGIGITQATTGAKAINNVIWSDRVFSPSSSTWHQAGIQPRGTAVQILNNTIHDVQLGIEINTDGGIVTGTVSGNTMTNIDVGNEENADCIFVGATMRDAGYGLIIEDNDCSGYADDGIDLYGGTNVIVQDNYIHDSGESTTSNSGLKVGGPSGTRTGNIIQRNFVYVRGGGSQADFGLVANGLTNGFIRSNIMVADVEASACMEINEFGTAPNGGGTGNTVDHNVCDGKIGLYVRTEAGAGTIARNNILIGSVSDINVETSATLTGFTNRLAGTGVKAGNGTYTPTGDTTGAVTSWVGGTAPTTAAGFKLSASSPLRRAGTELNVGGYQDIGGRAFSHPPSIGAWEAASGDEAASRTPRN